MKRFKDPIVIVKSMTSGERLSAIQAWKPYPTSAIHSTPPLDCGRRVGRKKRIPSPELYIWAPPHEIIPPIQVPLAAHPAAGASAQRPACRESRRSENGS